MKRLSNEADAFVESRIPKKEMTKMNPAPDSNDPILQDKDIDFEKNMVLVAFSVDPNQFIGVSISGVKRKNDRLIVTIEYDRPDPREIQQKVINYGQYFAAVVPRYDGVIEFIEK